MRIITYHFNEGGIIPGVPRAICDKGYAGLEVDIDDDTGEVVEIRHPKAPQVEENIVNEVESHDNHE